jgi:hypothetical protein
MKKTIFVILSIALLLLAACATDNAEAPEQMQQDGQQLPPLDGTEGGPAQSMGGGPETHVAQVTTSTDQIDWGEATTIQEAASVPDALMLTQDIGDFTAGTLMTVYVDASEMEAKGAGYENIGMQYSTDNGETWSEMQKLAIEGSEEHLPVDPSIYQLEDGTLLIHYFDFLATNPQNNADSYDVYVASSSDGLDYTVEQMAYTQEGMLTDPDLIYYNDQWLLYFVDWEYQSISVAYGDDPYSFSDAVNTGIEGIPGTMIVNDLLHLYGCSIEDGMTASTSSEGTIFDNTWGMHILGGGGCDPAPVLLGDGTFLMVFKGFT